MKTMISLIAAVVITAFAYPATVTERIAELDAATGVSDVFEVPGSRADHPVFTNWDVARLAYLYSDAATGVVQDNAVEVWIDAQGACWWAGRRPSVLPQIDVKFLTSRTASGWGALTAAAQSTAIQGFCNSVYQSVNVGAGNIREFSVSPVDGTTIRVSGYFDIGTTWQQQTWYVRLIDANGSVSAPYSNIEFQRVAQTVAP